MRLRAAGVLLAGCVGGSAVASDAPGLVGRVVPPYPDGMHSPEGACVGPAHDAEHVCDHGIGVVADAGGTPRHVVAQEDASAPGAREAAWRILDALPYPALAAGEQLKYGVCERDGVADPLLVAVVDAAGDVEWYGRVRAAWRLELDRGRFVATGTRGIRCLNEGYGYDG